MEVSSVEINPTPTMTEVNISATKLLVSYSDSSDADTDKEDEVQIIQDRRSAGSYDSETDSESSSSSSESSSSSRESDGSDRDDLPPVKVDCLKEKVNNETKDSVKGMKFKKERGPGKARVQVEPADLPQMQELHITIPKDEVQQVGHVFTIVECKVIIQTLADLSALNLDTMLFFENGDAFGQICDVFGPIPKPFYSVLFNSEKAILDKNISIKMPVYFAPKKAEYTEFVFTANLKRMKGCDASWKDDNEPPDSKLDFSDDEQERVAKSRGKGKTFQGNKEPTQILIKNKPHQQTSKNNNLGPHQGRSRPRPSFMRPVFSNSAHLEPVMPVANMPMQHRFPHSIPSLRYPPPPRPGLMVNFSSPPPMLPGQYNWPPRFALCDPQQSHARYPNQQAYSESINFCPLLPPPPQPPPGAFIGGYGMAGPMPMLPPPPPPPPPSALTGGCEIIESSTIQLRAVTTVPQVAPANNEVLRTGSLLPNPFRESNLGEKTSGENYKTESNISLTSLYAVAPLETSVMPMFPPSGFVSHSSSS